MKDDPVTQTPSSPADPTRPAGPPTPGGGAPAAPPTTPPPAAPAAPGKDPLRGSRTSGLWVALIGFGLVLVLLVVFVLQNTQEVDITFLGFEGRAPLSAALLAAAGGGILLTAVAGTLRILQLRLRVRREAKRR